MEAKLIGRKLYGPLPEWEARGDSWPLDPDLLSEDTCLECLRPGMATVKGATRGMVLFCRNCGGERPVPMFRATVPRGRHFGCKTVDLGRLAV